MSNYVICFTLRYTCFNLFLFISTFVYDLLVYSVLALFRVCFCFVNICILLLQCKSAIVQCGVNFYPFIQGVSKCWVVGLFLFAGSILIPGIIYLFVRFFQCNAVGAKCYATTPNFGSNFNLIDTFMSLSTNCLV